METKIDLDVLDIIPTNRGTYYIFVSVKCENVEFAIEMSSDANEKSFLARPNKPSGVGIILFELPVWDSFEIYANHEFRNYFTLAR
jgi:hypothetical protein